MTPGARCALDSGSAWTRLGYTGEPMGWHDGTVYLRARHYQPALGRFLQRDTFPGIPTRPQSLHKYLYAENNPATYTDPSGQCVPKGRFFGDDGCTWFWETNQGPNFADAGQWFWNVFQNIGLPGAIIGDAINTLRGQPTGMTEHILQQDGRAAVLGGLFRDIATGGSGRLPQVAQLVAGWSFIQQTRHIICNPVSPGEELGYAATTLVFILTVAGGPASIGSSGGGLSWSTAAGPALAGTSAMQLVTVSTQRLAGAVAGQPGIIVLMADSGSGGDDNLEIAFRLRGQAGAFRKTVPGAKDWEALGLDSLDPNFANQLYNYMQKAKKIHFDVTGMRMINTPDGVLRGPVNLNPPGSTNWELRTIWDDTALRSKTQFYLNGKKINERQLLQLP
ncbi:MAG: RHS repeat-associated core domain-containing protein [Blastochloris sp.]|nr:RHS repeat-associated core domain-containing protein [Blastochloris sp.]